MSEISLSTAPLFRTSLRSWQANYKARHGQAAAGEQSAEPRLQRLSRPKRRVRRPVAKAQA